MPILLYCVGAICFAVGLAMAAYGIPVSEFSFGNTLINAGSTIATGGIIVFSLGAVVSRLQLLLEAGGAHLPASMPQPPEAVEAAPQGARIGGRMPFPVRPKAEPLQSMPVVTAVEAPSASEAPVLAPILPNPDEPPLAVAETDLAEGEPEPHAASELPEQQPLEEPTSAFDKEWPAPEPPRERSFGIKWPERVSARPPVEAEAAAPVEAVEGPSPAVEPSPEAEKPAVLKSGVVDGMGYTLYVDGSIEAELPQGTLRFASINELREHLEQNS